VSVLAELVQVRRGRAPFVAMPGPATLAGSAAASVTASATLATFAAPALAAAPAASPERGAVEEIILVDPVCGMHVDAADVRHIADHEGRTYAFCCAGCRTRFAKNPARYLALA